MNLAQPPSTAWDIKFTLLRVPVRVHPVFWIICVLFSIGERVPYEDVAIGVALVFVSILVHEFGHALSGRYFGERHNSIILYSMGGLCVHEDQTERHIARIWTLLWGPLAGFVLGAISLRIWVITDWGATAEAHVRFILYNAMLINLGWGAVNLFPVFPLDGGQILREVLRWKHVRRSDLLVCTVSMYVGAAAALIALAANILYKIGLFPALLFGALAIQNALWRRQLKAMGDYDQEEEAPRQPWEQDADWWKRK